MTAVAETTIERSSWSRVVGIQTRILSPAISATFVLTAMGVTSVKHMAKSPLNFVKLGGCCGIFLYFE